MHLILRRNNWLIIGRRDTGHEDDLGVGNCFASTLLV